LNKVYLKHRFEDIELYDDVLPTLDILSRHFKIGLLSNGNSYPDRCGLEGRFAFVILSQDVQREVQRIPAHRICIERSDDPLLYLFSGRANRVYLFKDGFIERPIGSGSILFRLLRRLHAGNRAGNSRISEGKLEREINHVRPVRY
jgi:hypothetical protein